MSKNKKVLVVINCVAEFVELFEISLHLKRQGDYDFYILYACNFDYAEVDAQVQKDLVPIRTFNPNYFTITPKEQAEQDEKRQKRLETWRFIGRFFTLNGLILNLRIGYHYLMSFAFKVKDRFFEFSFHKALFRMLTPEPYHQLSDRMAEAVDDFFDRIINSTREFFTECSKAIDQFFDANKKTLGGVLGGLGKWVFHFFLKLWTAIVKIFSMVLSGLHMVIFVLPYRGLILMCSPAAFEYYYRGWVAVPVHRRYSEVKVFCYHHFYKRFFYYGIFLPTYRLKQKIFSTSISLPAYKLLRSMYVSSNDLASYLRSLKPRFSVSVQGFDWVPYFCKTLVWYIYSAILTISNGIGFVIACLIQLVGLTFLLIGLLAKVFLKSLAAGIKVLIVLFFLPFRLLFHGLALLLTFLHWLFTGPLNFVRIGVIWFGRWVNYFNAAHANITQSIWFFGYLAFHLQKVKKFLHTYKFDYIIAAEGSMPYEITYLSRYAKETNTKVIIFPYTLANWREYFEAYKDHELYVTSNFIAKIIKIFDPALVLSHQKQEALRIPSYFYPVYKYFDLISPQPWIMNSCKYVDVVAVESEYIQDYFREGGLPERVMKVVGSGNLDNLYLDEKSLHTRRQEVVEKYALAPTKPLLLVAPPPDQIVRPMHQFKSYDEFIEYYMKVVRTLEPDLSILYRFHPRISRNQVEEYEKRFAIKAANENTSWLMPISDGYVATVSATIRWALSLGIPVTNYDVFHYRYNDYDKAANIETVFDTESFVRALNRQRDAMQVGLNRRELGNYWGQVDGQSLARIKKLMCDLSKPKFQRLLL